MKLNYKSAGEGTPLIIIHGLFGSLDNWQSLAKRFAEDCKVFSIDMRNHGKSPHSEEFNYNAMAEDLLEFIYEHQLLHSNLIGHSMGGKVAMTFAQRWPEMVDKLVVADMGIKEYPPHHDHILAGLMDLYNENPTERKEAASRLSEFVPQPSVQQFLLKNLYWKDGVLKWRMNVPVINDHIKRILEPLSDETSDVFALFLRGEESDYVLDEDFDSISNVFPNSSFSTLPGAGHWLHADNPDAFFEVVLEFLNEH